MSTSLFARNRCGLLLVVAAALCSSALLAACGGSSGNPTDRQTNGNYAPLVVQKPITPTKGYAGPLVADPDSQLRQGQDLQMLLAHDGGTHFTLTVVNVSSLGAVDAFTFFPAAGTTIARVTSVSPHGHCSSTGSAISCNVHLHAPSCTCRGDGGQVVIGFDVTAKSWLGKGLLSGTVNVSSLAPSLYGVPSTPLSPDVNCSAAHLSKAAARLCAAAHA